MAAVESKIQFSTQKIFDLVSVDVDPKEHNLLMAEIERQWPHGISIPITFSVKTSPTTDH